MWDAIRRTLAVILVLAAISKLVGGPVRGSVLDSFLPGGFGTDAVIVIELFTASLLLCFVGKVGWLIATGTYSMLLVVSLVFLATDRECGCFGGIGPRVLPLFVDVIALAALFRCRRNAMSVTEKVIALPLLRSVSVAAIATMLLVVVAPDVVAWGRPVWTEEGITDASIKSLLPGDYVSEAELKEITTILILKRGCARCEMVLQKASQSSLLSGSGVTRAWIESGGVWRMSSTIGAEPYTIQWPTGTEPYVETPIAILLDGDRVARVLSYKEIEDEIDSSG